MLRKPAGVHQVDAITSLASPRGRLIDFRHLQQHPKLTMVIGVEKNIPLQNLTQVMLIFSNLRMLTLCLMASGTIHTPKHTIWAREIIITFPRGIIRVSQTNSNTTRIRTKPTHFSQFSRSTTFAPRKAGFYRG